MPEITEETLASLAKSQEGTMLGLQAVAEALQKMDARFSKAEDEDNEEEAEKKRLEEEEAEKIEKSSLVKEIAALVVKELKAGLEDLGGKDEVKVSGTKWPMSSNPPGEDQEEKKEPRTTKGSEESQKAIQAMSKEEVIKKEDEHVPGCKCEKCLEKNNEEEFDKYPEEVKSLAKQLGVLRKENEALKKSQTDAIQKGVEVELKNHGFVKEAKTGVSLSTLGTDGVQIIKSEEKIEDNMDSLIKLPWNVLWDLKLRNAAGNTEGLPKELIGG